MKLSHVLAASLAVTACGLSFTRTAHAGLSACGNIDVEANSMCKVEVAGGCTAKCTPVSFEAACAAKLETTCQGMCTGSATASCTAACDAASCEAECNTNPGMFDCA